MGERLHDAAAGERWLSPHQLGALMAVAQGGGGEYGVTLRRGAGVKPENNPKPEPGWG